MDKHLYCMFAYTAMWEDASDLFSVSEEESCL